MIERAAARPRNVPAAAIVWVSGYDRVASIFGPAMAPLVARSLRYYSRSNKVRLNFSIALPVLAFVTLGRPLPGDAPPQIRRLAGGLRGSRIPGNGDHVYQSVWI